MYTINTIPHVKCFVRYLPTRCFCIRNLTRSVNTVRQHFPWSILYVCSLVSLRTDATPLQSIQSSRANATPSSGTSPLASKEVTPPHPNPPVPLWEFPTMFCQTLRLHHLPLPLPLVLNPFPILRGRSDRSHATGSIAWLRPEPLRAKETSEERRARKNKLQCLFSKIWQAVAELCLCSPYN